MSDDPDDRGLSAAQIAKQIDASLARLRTDYVDLYQAHRFDPDVPIEETIEALQQVVSRRQGPLPGLQRVDRRSRFEAALEIAGPDLFVSSQPQYSMLWQAPGGRGLPAVRGQRHLPDRLVPARPGRADRQVQARPAAAPPTRVRPTRR